MVLVCQLCANYPELGILDKNLPIIMQRRMLTIKNFLILREPGQKKVFQTTNQGVACSNHAGCTSDINDLRQTQSSAAFLLRHSSADTELDDLVTQTRQTIRTERRRDK